MLQHENMSVRLMARFIIGAYENMLEGNVNKAAIFSRLAEAEQREFWAFDGETVKPRDELDKRPDANLLRDKSK
mgnify:FL=1